MAHQNKWSGQILSVSEKPIISVKEARKILGKEYDNVSDDNLLGIIRSLHQIANYYLDSIKVPNNA
jgi:hypothetical protein